MIDQHIIRLEDMPSGAIPDANYQSVTAAHDNYPALCELADKLRSYEHGFVAGNLWRRPIVRLDGNPLGSVYGWRSQGAGLNFTALGGLTIEGLMTDDPAIVEGSTLKWLSGIPPAPGAPAFDLTGTSNTNFNGWTLDNNLMPEGHPSILLAASASQECHTHEWSMFRPTGNGPALYHHAAELLHLESVWFVNNGEYAESAVIVFSSTPNGGAVSQFATIKPGNINMKSGFRMDGGFIINNNPNSCHAILSDGLWGATFRNVNFQATHSGMKVVGPLATRDVRFTDESGFGGVSAGVYQTSQVATEGIEFDGVVSDREIMWFKQDIWATQVIRLGVRDWRTPGNQPYLVWCGGGSYPGPQLSECRLDGQVNGQGIGGMIAVGGAIDDTNDIDHMGRQWGNGGTCPIHPNWAISAPYGCSASHR